MSSIPLVASHDDLIDYERKYFEWYDPGYPAKWFGNTAGYRKMEGFLYPVEIIDPLKKETLPYFLAHLAVGNSDFFTIAKALGHCYWGWWSMNPVSFGRAAKAIYDGVGSDCDKHDAIDELFEAKFSDKVFFRDLCSFRREFRRGNYDEESGTLIVEADGGPLVSVGAGW